MAGDRDHPLEPTQGLTRRHLLGGGAILGAGLLTREYVVLPDRPLDALLEEYANEASLFVRLAGTLVHVRDQGPRDAEPLVLVHGFASSLHTWSGWVDTLTPEFRVITLDLPGFGLTGPSGDHVYTQDRYVQVVDALADHLALETFALGGNSMGGGVAWHYALDHPERLTGLVLVDAVGYQSNEDDDGPPLWLGDIPLVSDIMRYTLPRFVVAALVESAHGQPDETVTSDLVDRYHDLLLRPGNREALVNMDEATATDRTVELETLETPTLVQWGELDTWIPPGDAERFAADLPNSHLVTYPDLGHVPMEEAPRQTAADVAAFLER